MAKRVDLARFVCVSRQPTNARCASVLSDPIGSLHSLICYYCKFGTDVRLILSSLSIMFDYLYSLSTAENAIPGQRLDTLSSTMNPSTARSEEDLHLCFNCLLNNVLLSCPRAQPLKTTQFQTW